MPVRKRPGKGTNNSSSNSSNSPPKEDGQRHQDDEAFPSTSPPESCTRIVKKLAMYRVVLFGILLHDFVTYLPQRPLPPIGPDAWFTYDQFQFLYDWTPKLHPNDPMGIHLSMFIYGSGILTCILAMIGGIPRVQQSFELFSTIFLCLYAFRFFTLAQFFTNHNYLFLLLGILVTITGGGSLFPSKNDSNNNNKQQQQLLIQKSEWGSITIRLQYAIIYLFASLWKLITKDWMDGSICQNIFLSFEDQGVHRGVPWHDLHDMYGPVLFELVAIGGLILDTGMFLALTFRRPTQDTVRGFTILSVLFHGFVCLTMSQRIGYMFPLCCLSGSLIFQPIGRSDEELATVASSKKKNDDISSHQNQKKKASSSESDEANLIGWIHRYLVGGPKVRASPRQRQFTLLWLFLQLALPLRMPIFTKNTWPITGRCYRFSWTMMLHMHGTAIGHSGMMDLQPHQIEPHPFSMVLDMVSLYPKCAEAVPILRDKYFPETMNVVSDPRTIPLDGILQLRHRAMVDQFPRYIARVAGGWSDLLYHQAPNACYNVDTGETRQAQVYGNVHIQLNRKGAYSRLFDPTVNLVASDHARQSRGVLEFLRGWILDLAPAEHEYMLPEGVGSMSNNDRVENIKKEIQKQFPHVKRVEMIADRTSCLRAQSISFFTNGYPLGAMLVEAPEHVTIQVETRTSDTTMPIEKQWEALSEPTTTTLQPSTPAMAVGNMIEIIADVDRKKKASFSACGATTEEDILIALLFMY